MHLGFLFQLLYVWVAFAIAPRSELCKRSRQQLYMYIVIELATHCGSLTKPYPVRPLYPDSMLGIIHLCTLVGVEK